MKYRLLILFAISATASGFFWTPARHRSSEGPKSPKDILEYHLSAVTYAVRTGDLLMASHLIVDHEESNLPKIHKELKGMRMYVTSARFTDESKNTIKGHVVHVRSVNNSPKGKEKVFQTEVTIVKNPDSASGWQFSHPAN